MCIRDRYLTMHEKFVREDISYIDQRTGDEKTFNSVTLPKNTVIDGVDVGYYQFSPLFVNPSRFKGEHLSLIHIFHHRGRRDHHRRRSLLRDARHILAPIVGTW